MKTLKIFAAFLVAINAFACKKADVGTPVIDSVAVVHSSPGFTLGLDSAPNYVVAADGTGNYTTVQAALNAVPANSSARTIIYIKNGTYKEVVTVAANKINVSLVGQSANGVKLTYDNYSSKINPATGTGYGTGGSSSSFINGQGFYATNITFENSSGPVGQALAVNITADKSVFYNCKFLGRQDTWYAANCRIYLKNCYIEGTTDFIFGSATAFFDGCSIYSYGGSALTAANTASYVTYGLVFNHCTVTGASGVTTDMGRTWGGYAATAFLNSSLSSIISAGGWSDWGNTANDATARYAEYGNTGTGANTSGRVSWDHLLTSSQASNYTSYLNVLKTTYSSTPVTDNWDPTVVINDPVTPPAGTITSGSVYSIINKNSSKGLDVTALSTADGALIQQWGYTGTSNQQFKIIDVGGGYYEIMAMNSSKAIEVQGASTANLASIDQLTYSGATNQQWQIVYTGSGYFKIINRNSGKAMEVKDSNTSNGTPVQQYNFNNASNYYWQLNLVSTQ
ncbi:pectinesterase family protein [Mucilaginibacter sp. AW1-3]